MEYLVFKDKIGKEFTQRGIKVDYEDESLLINYGMGSCMIDIKDMFQELIIDEKMNFDDSFIKIWNAVKETDYFFDREINWDNVYPFIRNKEFGKEINENLVKRPLFHDLAMYLAEEVNDYLRFILVDEIIDEDNVYKKAFFNLKGDEVNLVKLRDYNAYMGDIVDGKGAARFFNDDVIDEIKTILGRDFILGFVSDGLFLVSKPVLKGIIDIRKVMDNFHSKADIISKSIYRFDYSETDGNVSEHKPRISII